MGRPFFIDVMGGFNLGTLNPIFVQKFRNPTMSPATEQVFSVLYDVAFWSSLLPLTIGLLRFRRCSYGLRCLVILAVVSFSADVLNELFREDKLTTYVPRVYTMAEFTLISIFFIGEIPRRQIRYLIIVLNVLFIGVVATDLFLQGAMQIDNLSTGIESIVFLIYSLMVFYFVMRDMVYPNLLATPQFWIISGIMIYFGGNIFLFAFGNYLVKTSMELFKTFWYVVHTALMITYFVLISTGLWKARKQYQ